MTSKGPDLVLVNPGNRAKIYQSLGSELSAIEPPVWACIMASFIRQRGYSVAVLDANAEGISPEEAAARIADMEPAVTAVAVYGHNPSASTQVMPSASAICAALKEQRPESKVLLVGGHVAALPERTLREEVSCDFVCDGEGLYTLEALIQLLKSGGEGDLGKVPGLWYRDGDTPRQTAAVPLVRDLTCEIPDMPWALLPMETYRAHNWHCFDHLSQRQPYASIYTTLGCPFHCSYCCIQAPFRTGERALGYKPSANSYRFWSPDWVIAQIDALVNDYGVRNIKFADEMFVLNRRHVEGICDRIIERGYDLNIWAYARVDTVKADMLDKMKRAGFNWFCYGFESGSDRVRNDVHKGFEQDKAYKAMEMTRKAGIYVIGNYMFGLPEDDMESMQATLDLALELNCEFANFYSAMAYPGSELYTRAVKEGRALPATWSGYSQHAADCLPLPTRHLSGAEVLRFRDEAWREYFDNPAYLDMITRTFGPLTTEHIREMASHKLERATV